MKSVFAFCFNVAFAISLFASSESSFVDPEEVFRNPPQSAKTGVWWHWMGSNVSKEGIVKDLDWFAATGIGSATIFGMCDVCVPWAAEIKDCPTGKLLAFTPAWWEMVRFACDEAEKRGIELGIHNCPGYTSTGGPWIPPHLSMRELVFNVTNASKQISLTAKALFPVQIGDTGKIEKPQIPSRRADLREIAVVDGIRVQHIPMGSFTQPNQWEMFGLECDKMNPEAVAFHLDYVIGDMKKYLGRHVGKTLKFVLLDSYEAGVPSWTPKMREEFKARRGYDPLAYLPILGGYKVSVAPDKNAENKFKSDYRRTIEELYRDVLFKIMHEKLNAVGLEFACEPYGGPFKTHECAPYVDRIMTEFWFRPGLNRRVPRTMGWNRWKGPNGKRHNVIEAEAFTSGPPHCNWTETPYYLKASGDSQFYRGVNRMILHTCPHQPWSDEILPGKVMGRWGTHFGRNQTWAKDGKGFFQYLNRCQALLQWGEPSNKRIVGNNILPAGTSITAQCREKDGVYVFYMMNHTDRSASLEISFPQIRGKDPEWFDPVTGEIAPLKVINGRAPLKLAPCGSGFLVFRKNTGTLKPTRQSAYLQKLSKPAKLEGECVAGPWNVSFGDVKVVMSKLQDWTKLSNNEAKYFSGTAKYQTTFVMPKGKKADILSLGNCNRQVAKVSVNGVCVGTLWCEPYEILLPEGLVKEGRNTLNVEFTNVWANRLIGDEQEMQDCEFVKAPYPGGWFLNRYPEWFKKGLSARPSKGRRCFTDWKYFTKDSKLVPSGLMGPVVISTIAAQ
jgi:hypothetical protein